MTAVLGFASLSVAPVELSVAPVDAAVVRIPESAFSPDAGLIMFSEFSVGAVNPTYTPADYGGVAGAPTVTFDGYFDGQALSAAPGVDCSGRRFPCSRPVSPV